MSVRLASVQRAREPARIVVIAMLMGLVLGTIHCGEEAPTAPDPSPTKLSFSVQPTSATAGAVIAPAVQVAVQDAQGNTVTSSTATITLAISSGTGTAGAVLGGTSTRAAVDGIAMFDDLTFDKAGTAYTLTATATNLASATSTAFDVEPRAGMPTSISLQSDPGDYIGQGLTYQYTQADAIITVDASAGHLSLSIDGDEWWFADFQVPDSLTQLEPGMYSNLTRYPFHDPAVGGLDWFGEGRGCNTLTGWFAIDSVSYRNGVLAVIDLRFEQHCEGQSPALRGTIHWDADDPTMPPGPVVPIPAGLWQPAPGSTPATGNYVYLVSDVGDYIGQGQTLTYTPTDATITVTPGAAYLSITVSGWLGQFQAMVSVSDLEPGYYPDLRRYPFHNPARGGLSWSGQGRACNRLTGWFAIDAVAYASGTLTAIDLRFEQHCEGTTPALHGAIHWEG